MLGGSWSSVGVAVRANQRPPEHEDHGAAHDGHADQHDHVDDEGDEDAAAVHHPALPQVCTERQVLGGYVWADGNVTLSSRRDQQRQGHEHRHQPGEGDEGGGAFPTKCFEAKRVADRHVALEAERGHVEDGGVAAGFEQEVVDLTGSVARGGREREPDGAVELDGHADEEHQQVRARQADHVVRHVLLQVAVALQHLRHSDSDRITHNTRHQDEAVKDGQEDFEGVVGFQLPPVFLLWYLHFLAHGCGALSSDIPAIDSLLLAYQLCRAQSLWSEPRSWGEQDNNSHWNFSLVSNNSWFFEESDPAGEKLRITRGESFQATAQKLNMRILQQFLLLLSIFNVLSPEVGCLAPSPVRLLPFLMVDWDPREPANCRSTVEWFHFSLSKVLVNTRLTQLFSSHLRGQGG